ncbi:uncharacterized protein AB9W97_014969 isoform 3-T3 [Spinachia spinachia]
MEATVWTGLLVFYFLDWYRELDKELMGKRKKINPGVSSAARISPSYGRTSVSWRRGSRHAERERERVREHLGAVTARLPRRTGRTSPIPTRHLGRLRGWRGVAADVMGEDDQVQVFSEQQRLGRSL